MGGAGDDEIVGGESEDKLYGGDGTDIFLCNERNEIADFSEKEGDRLVHAIEFDEGEYDVQADDSACLDVNSDTTHQENMDD